MGIFRKERREISPEHLGAQSVAQAIKVALGGHDSLYPRLLEIGMPVSNPFYSETETIIYCLTPFDIILSGKFGPAAWATREALLQKLVEWTKMRLESSDVARIPWNSWPQYVSRRFEEYVTALRSRPGGDGLRAMSTLAYQRITGIDSKSGDPEAYLKGSLILAQFFSMLYSTIPKDLDDLVLS